LFYLLIGGEKYFGILFWRFFDSRKTKGKTREGGIISKIKGIRLKQKRFIK